MATGNFDIKEIEKRMKGAVSALKSEFGGLRTGRASTTLLDPLMVNTSYGAKMPINQVASINAPEPRLITVCLLYTSPSPRDRQKSRMPSSA